MYAQIGNDGQATRRDSSTVWNQAKGHGTMGRKTTGTVFKRGNNYYVRYQLNGKRADRALRDDDGRPITDPDAAEDARKAMFSALVYKDKAKQRREMATALSTAEDEAKRAEETARERQAREQAERNKLAIADAWERFPYTVNTRGKTKRRLSDRTIRDNASHWGTFATWAEEQGILAVEDITENHTAAFSLALRDRMTGNRHNKIMFTCSVVCRLSGRPDPFANVDSYESDPVHRENLEPDEIRQVIEAAPGELSRLFVVATYTGFRLGDCATLQWADVHMDENGGRIIRKTGKTKKMVRFPMHPGLRAELERTPASDRTGDVCPELADIYRRDSARLSKLTRQVFESCDLETQAKGKEGRAAIASVRGFHSFRHSFATECARGGIPLGLVQEWLGHSSPEITRIYENWKIDRDGGQILAALPSMAKALPEPAECDGPAVKIETERDRLRALADSLPVARVRELLAIAETWVRE
jgi:integrase